MFKIYNLKTQQATNRSFRKRKRMWNGQVKRDNSKRFPELMKGMKPWV